MKVKTFSGGTINEALTAVKEDMGDSVLILETRNRLCDGIRGVLGKKVVEVIVADDDTGQAADSPFSVLGIARGDDEEDPFSDDFEEEEQEEPVAPPRAIIRPPEELTKGRRTHGRKGTRALRPTPESELLPEPMDRPTDQSMDELIGEAPSNGTGLHDEEMDALGFDLSDAPIFPGTMPPAQLPAVLHRVQEIEQAGNGVAYQPPPPQAGPPSGAKGYQAPHFARLPSDGSPQTLPPSRMTPAEELGPLPEGLESSWQRGPQNFAVEKPREETSARPPELEETPAKTPAKTPALKTKPKARRKPRIAPAALGEASFPETYRPILKHLVDQDVPESMARSLMKYVLRSRGAEATRREIHEELTKALNSVIRVAPIPDRQNPRPVEEAEAEKGKNQTEGDDPWKILESDTPEELGSEFFSEDPGGTAAEAPSIIAFVGTAGSGKTTSLAKVAAHFANQKLRTAGLIAIETAHDGSGERLKSYGDLMGVPVRRVSSPAQLAEAVKAMGDCAYLFIDAPACSLREAERTNGRSPFEPKHLKLFLESVPGVQKHLVLNATTRARDLIGTAKAFEPLAIDALLFTRLDETGALGHLLSLLQETGLPVSYTSAGREIPGDLDSATTEGLAEKILGFNG